MRTDMIVRHVKVNRVRTPRQMLNALLGRKQYVVLDLDNIIPRCEGEEVDVHFFKTDRQLSNDELTKEYESRGLTPVDTYSLAAVNEDDPAFGDEHPNGTHWKDTQGRWCGLYCSRNADDDYSNPDRGERFVTVDRFDDCWPGDTWIGGVLKS